MVKVLMCDDQVEGCDPSSLLQVLPMFKHLTTIVIDLPPNTALAIQHFNTSAGATNNESIAQLIFDACPSLLRVTFSSSSQWSWEEGRCLTFQRDGERGG